VDSRRSFGTPESEGKEKIKNHKKVEENENQ